MLSVAFEVDANIADFVYNGKTLLYMSLSSKAKKYYPNDKEKNRNSQPALQNVVALFEGGNITLFNILHWLCNDGMLCLTRKLLLHRGGIPWGVRM